MSYFNQPPHGREMDMLQRDGLTYEDEPETGSCWNCGHTAPVRIGNKWYDLCVRNRDIDASGDVELADDSIRNCEDWDDYSY